MNRFCYQLITLILLLAAGWTAPQPVAAQFITPNQLPGCTDFRDYSQLRLLMAQPEVIVLSCPNSVSQATGSTGIIRFGIDHHNDNWKANLKRSFVLNIKYYNGQTIIHESNETLTIDYKTQGNAEEIDFHTFKKSFTNPLLTKIAISITDVLNNSGASLFPLGNQNQINNAIPAGLTLKTELIYEGYPKLECDACESPNNLCVFDPSLKALPKDDDQDNRPDRLEVSWDQNPNALEYDLEWDFTDFYYADGANSHAFARGTTRITTAQTYFSIPLVYEKGYIHIRMRPVTRRGQGEQRWEGDWFCFKPCYPIEQDHTRCPNPGPNCPGVNNGQNLNWSSSMVFAEEGKCNVVVNYFDGISRSRQTVSSVNSNARDQVAIVAETFYDYRGKAAIATLPAPVLPSPVLGGNQTIASVLRYYENFNQAPDGNPYRNHHFDRPSGSTACTAGSECAESGPIIACPMGTASGSSRYYSANNPLITGNIPSPHTNIPVLKSNAQSYLPDAFGYPFVHTEFTPDETGRVLRQGGAGIHHQIGTGHETSFFYATPTQVELNRLFGTDVGLAEHYFKKVVRDPNGSLSLSYEDMKGRVIATALLGIGQENPDLLPLGEIPENTAHENLLRAAENKLIGDDILLFNKKILIEREGAYHFEYQLFSSQVRKVLDQICPTCKYRLEISLTDQCGNHQLNFYTDINNTQVTLPESLLTQNISQDDFNETECLTGESVPNTPYSTFHARNITTYNLPVGEYTLTKKLVIDKQHIEQKVQEYRTRYQEVNTKDQAIEDWLSNHAPESGCFNCADCNVYLGPGEVPVCTTLVTPRPQQPPTNLVQYKPNLNEDAYALIQFDNPAAYCSIPAIQFFLDELKATYGTAYQLSKDDKRKAILIYTEVLNSCKRQNCNQCNLCESRCGSCGTWDEAWLAGDVSVATLLQRPTTTANPYLVAKLNEFNDPDYVLEKTDKDIIQAGYNDLLAECKRLACQNTGKERLNPCEIAYQAMLADVIPGGQYAQYNVTTDQNGNRIITFVDETSPTSIWKKLHDGVLLHEDDPITGNQVDSKILINGSYVTTDQDPIKEDLSLILDNWKASWAKDLVKLHPEYCRYLTCSSFVKVEYLQKMETTETAEAACQQKLWLPFGVNTPTNCLPNNCQPTIDDFDYICGCNPNVINAQLNQRMLNYQTLDNSITLSIWDAAAYMTTNGTISPSNGKFCNIYPNATVETQNRIWQNFRAMYRSLREEFAQTCIRDGACINSCLQQNTNLLNGGTVPQGKKSRFATPEELKAQLNRKINEENKGNFDINKTDPQNIAALSEKQLADMAEKVCKQYGEQWKQALQGCYPGQETQLNRLVEALKKVCIHNYDADHPFSYAEPKSNPTSSNSIRKVFEEFQIQHSLTINAGCNPYLVVMPNIDQNIDVQSGLGLMDECACQKITQAYDAFTANPGGAASFSEYLNTHPFIIDGQSVSLSYTDAELRSILQQCKCLGQVPQSPVDPGFGFMPAGNADYNNEPVFELGVPNYNVIAVDAISTSDFGIISVGRLIEQQPNGLQAFFIQKIGPDGNQDWAKWVPYQNTGGGTPMSVRETENGYAVISYLHGNGNLIHTHFSPYGGILSAQEIQGTGAICGILSATQPIPCSANANLAFRTDQGGGNNLLLATNAKTRNNTITPMLMLVDSGGSSLWSKGYLFDTLNRKAYFVGVNEATGGYIATGNIEEIPTLQNPYNHKQLLLCRLDQQGNPFWHRTFRADHPDTNLTAIYTHQTEDGRLLTVAALSHYTDNKPVALMVLQTDPDGNLTQTRRVLLPDLLGNYEYNPRTISVSATDRGDLLLNAARKNVQNPAIQNSVVLQIRPDLSVAGAFQVDAPLNAVSLYSARPRDDRYMILAGQAELAGTGSKEIVLGMKQPEGLVADLQQQGLTHINRGSYRIAQLPNAQLSMEATVSYGSPYLMKTVNGFTMLAGDTTPIINPGFYYQNTTPQYQTDSYGRVFNANKRLLNYFSDQSTEMILSAHNGPRDGQDPYTTTVTNPACDPEYAIQKIIVRNNGAQIGLNGRPNVNFKAEITFEATGANEVLGPCNLLVQPQYINDGSPWSLHAWYTDHTNTVRPNSFSDYWLNHNIPNTNNWWSRNYGGAVSIEPVIGEPDAYLITFKTNRSLWLKRFGVDPCKNGIKPCFRYFLPGDEVGMTFEYLASPECCDPCSSQAPLPLVPLALTCTQNCKTCSDLTTAISGFNTYAAQTLQISQNAPLDFNYRTLWTNYLNQTLGFNLSYSDYVEFIYRNCDRNFINLTATDGTNLFPEMPGNQNPNAKLCNRSIFPHFQPRRIPNCFPEYYDRQLHNILKKYETALEEAVQQFEDDLVKHCRNVQENLIQEVKLFQYQYTLYYYDQSGGLIMTVPPRAAVANLLLNDGAVIGDMGTVNTVRTANTGSVLPLYAQTGNDSYQLTTRYRYNSLKAVVESQSPDGGKSEFWYDEVGQLVLAQNARQVQYVNTKRYSYTLRDALNRPYEGGEVWTPGNNLPLRYTNDHFLNTANNVFNVFVRSGNNREVTRTYYDDIKFTGLMRTRGNGLPSQIALNQRNLRNRVASVTYHPAIYEPDQTDEDQRYGNAMHYTYDIAGNADLIVIDVPELEPFHSRFFRIAYDFDLVSGNVHRIMYQNDRADRWFHHNRYDADNRLTEVHTSGDSVHFTTDARYEYLLHDPLARMVLGEYQVQGLDFAYTIQGWIKGVNSGTLRPERDPGLDGYVEGSNLNRFVARDVFGYSLGYFTHAGEEDYQAIGFNSPLRMGNLSLSPLNYFLPQVANSTFIGSVRPLYNGNITSMVTALHEGTMAFTEDGCPREGITWATKVLGTTYRYDHLNRLKESITFRNINENTNAWGNDVLPTRQANAYKTAYNYDPNGNILNLQRYDWNGCLFDDLTYNYAATHNKLLKIRDAVAGSSDPVLKDLADQTNTLPNDPNYTYDAIGNLKSDAMEGIGNVSWNVGGKVTRVYKNAGSQPPRWMSFDYDVMGNRLMKRLDKATSVYVRDAKGNTMAVYEVKTEKKDGDTDAQAGQKLESFLAALYDQMPGGVNQTKTLSFIKYFIRPIEGANEQKITEIRNLLDGLRANGTVPPTPLTNKYNQVVSRINTLTGYDAPTNRDIFGANAEQYFRNHPWNPNILPPNLARTRHKTLRQKEVHLYGSSRLGVAERRTAKNENTYLVLSEIRVQEVENPFVAGNISGIFVSKIGDVAYTVPEENRFVSRLGMKRYELVNHLGNVQAVISDRALPVRNGNNVSHYTADLLSATDYYPFGMAMAGRSLNTDDYRYGFNGVEKEEDWNGDNNIYYTHHRMMDVRIGRWLSIDPLSSKYPGWSPFVFAMNNPIVLNDPDGDEPPSIKQILDEGKKSPTFTSLLKASNVTDKNYYTNIVTSKNNITYTDINSGRIYLTPGNDIKYQVIKLTHELTNKKNIGSAQKLNQDVSEGKITPQQYALQLAKVEVEGQINQVKVAADINFRYPGAGSASVNKLITDYSNNKSIDLTKKVTYSTEHLKHYEQQGKNLRENFVKSNSQPKPQPKKP